MKNRRSLVLAFAWTAAFVLSCASVSFAASEVAPDFTLKNMAGEDVKLTELLEDGPVVIDFWATWCKPCIKGFPQLQEIFDSYRSCGLRVLAVSIDGPKSTSRVGSFIKSKDYSFEVLLDSSQKVARKYHVSSVPRTVLVDTDGKIVYSVTGYRPTNHDELDKAVAAIYPEPCPEETEETEETGEAAEAESTEDAGE